MGSTSKKTLFPLEKTLPCTTLEKKTFCLQLVCPPCSTRVGWGRLACGMVCLCGSVCGCVVVGVCVCRCRCVWVWALHSLLSLLLLVFSVWPHYGCDRLWPNRLWPSLFDRLWQKNFDRLWPTLIDRLWPKNGWPTLAKPTLAKISVLVFLGGVVRAGVLHWESLQSGQISNSEWYLQNLDLLEIRILVYHQVLGIHRSKMSGCFHWWWHE